MEQLLKDLWEYATGAKWGAWSEEDCACEGEALQTLYLRVRVALNEREGGE